MANPTFTGTTYAELSKGWSRDPRSGISLVRSFLGQYETLAAMEATAAANGNKTAMEPQADGAYILRVNYGAEDSQSPDIPLSTVWELVGSRLEKSIWFLPSVVAAMDQIKDVKGQPDLHGRAVVKRAVLELVSGQWFFTDDTGKERELTETYVLQLARFYGMVDDFDSPNPTGNGVLRLLMREMIKGDEAFPVSQFVLRRTTTLASNSGDSLKPAYDNVNLIMTSDQLRVIEQPPTTLKFRIPDGYFLKDTPTVTQVAADKWSVVNEWTHSDEYSSLIYKRV